MLSAVEAEMNINVKFEKGGPIAHLAENVASSQISCLIPVQATSLLRLYEYIGLAGVIVSVII